MTIKWFGLQMLFGMVNWSKKCFSVKCIAKYWKLRGYIRNEPRCENSFLQTLQENGFSPVCCLEFKKKIKNYTIEFEFEFIKISTSCGWPILLLWQTLCHTIDIFDLQLSSFDVWPYGIGATLWIAELFRRCRMGIFEALRWHVSWPNDAKITNLSVKIWVFLIQIIVCIPLDHPFVGNSFRNDHSRRVSRRYLGK